MHFINNWIPKKTIIAGIIGNALEWYDFLLYAYFAPIIAPLFFPAKTPYISLVMTFSVFALGFLIRPLGALIFGSFGDRFGRKKALVLSISLMTIPTVAIGVLPSYASIGIMAPILLTLIRLMQGFAVSGEISSAASFLIEHAHETRRGFAGSLVMSSAFIGITIGAAIATLQTQVMTTATLTAWGWRIPFLVAGLFGILSIVLRLQTIESPKFLAIKTAQHTPVKLLFREHSRSLLCAIGMTTIVAIGNYFIVTYFNTFLVESGAFPPKQAMLINVLSMIVFAATIPCYGFLSDLLGRKIVFLSGAVGMFILAMPILWMVSRKNFAWVLFGEILFVIILAATSGLILTLLAEMFITKIRNTGASLAYNSSLALFGGTTPLIAITLVHITNNQIAPAWFLMAGALISALSAFLIPETSRKPLR